jgi:hypothetical protein
VLAGRRSLTATPGPSEALLHSREGPELASAVSLAVQVGVNFEFLSHVVNQRQVFMQDGIDYAQIMRSKMAGGRSGERMGKVCTTLRQCVRDWSSQGAAEREQCYGPIVAKLCELFPEPARERVTVLVPGSGLGRLPWCVLCSAASNHSRARLHARPFPCLPPVCIPH